MEWTWRLIIVVVLVQIVIAWMRRDTTRMRHEMLRDAFKSMAKQNTELAVQWHTIADDDAASETQRLTALHTATVLHGSSVAYQDAAQRVESFLVHNDSLLVRGVITVDTKALKPGASHGR